MDILVLKQTTDRAGKARHYAYNTLIDRWQRISADRYHDWLLAYFGHRGQTVRHLHGCGSAAVTIVEKGEPTHG